MRLCVFPAVFFYLFFVSDSIFAQDAELNIEKRDVASYIRFLASDELQGRKTGEQSNWVAARYLAEQFRYFGAKSPAGLRDDYLQVIPFVHVTPPKNGTLTIGDEVMQLADDLMIRSSPGGMTEGELLFLPQVLDSEITEEVRGKYVLTYIGSNNTNDPQAAFALSRNKKKDLMAHGALGIIEIYLGRHPWNLIKRYLGSGGLAIVEEEEGDSEFIVLAINNKMDEVIADLMKGKKRNFKLETDGPVVIKQPSANVVGVIEGTDPVLKNEYIALSAHFDHVGTSSSSERPQTQIDSIFNGARDNAFGVAALISAAEALAIEPAKRSILLIACTAEEIGLLGSKYFVENPVVPLDKIVFNLNTDGAGHSDSSIISVMGLNRVGAATEISEACLAYGLEPYADPAPEQNLFDRSDNVSFAAVGIPAPTFSPGFREFDKDIMRHYHQPSDEVETLDFDYVLKFCRAYALCARLIANKDERPMWSSGDKYEEAYKHLYQVK
ncbi:MAG: M28 family peptidase [Saprospiraceae bacterium]|nr:M28 family peptidase [Saprospiraceae bacterium]